MTETITFGTLEIAFDDRIIRPRPWTVMQSQWAAEMVADAPEGPVLELCSGAGHIGLLAVAGGDRHLVCVDADPVACGFARTNAETAGLAERVEVRCGRLEEALGRDERFAVVIADPPWVRREQTDDHPEDPLLAIDGGDDGLEVARACLRVIGRHLLAGGSAVLQLGTPEQVETLRAEPSVESGALVLGEVRTSERGVLVRVDPQSPSG